MGVERLAAAPLLFFENQPTALPQESITSVDVPFAIQIDINGGFSRIYQNLTGTLITDFQFTSIVPEDAVWQGGGGAPPPFFELVVPSPDRMGIDFFQEPPIGVGIAPGTIFEITGSGFLANSNTSLSAVATVPEPSAILLCCIGLCGFISVFISSAHPTVNAGPSPGAQEATQRRSPVQAYGGALECRLWQDTFGRDCF